MGDGHKADTCGICRNICVEIEAGNVLIDAVLFELGDIDIVLGMSWLHSLGEMTIDWSKKIMKFKEGGMSKMLKGIAGEEPLLASLEGILNEEKGHRDGELNQQKRLELEEILKEFDDVFQEPRGISPERVKAHSITLKPGEAPVNVRPYRYPYHQKNEIERQVKELLENGWIRHSQSEYSSPVILVKKKSNQWRMCVDYRALNKATIPDKFPILIIEELLDELHGAKYFSKLDLRSGYHQVRMKVEDIPKTTFRTHEGHYEYLVMPFGLMNAPATVQSLMNEVFRDLLRRGVLVFSDDILVYHEEWEEHIEGLRVVLGILRQHCLYANKEKCSFGQNELRVFGAYHHTTRSGSGSKQGQEHCGVACTQKCEGGSRIFGNYGLLP